MEYINKNRDRLCIDDKYESMITVIVHNHNIQKLMKLKEHFL